MANSESEDEYDDLFGCFEKDDNESTRLSHSDTPASSGSAPSASPAVPLLLLPGRRQAAETVEGQAREDFGNATSSLSIDPHQLDLTGPRTIASGIENVRIPVLDESLRTSLTSNTLQAPLPLRSPLRIRTVPTRPLNTLSIHNGGAALIGKGHSTVCSVQEPRSGQSKWFISKLSLAQLAFGDSMDPHLSPPLSRVKAGKRREVEAAETSADVAAKRRRGNDTNTQQQAGGSQSSSGDGTPTDRTPSRTPSIERQTQPSDDAQEEPEPLSPFAQDKADILDGVEQRVASLRQQERQLQATLYKTRVEHHVLTTARDTIDARLLELQRRRDQSGSVRARGKSAKSAVGMGTANRQA